MKKFLAFSLVVTLFFGVAHVANAAIIGFDDISGNVEVTNQYASLGITFQQTFELDTWNNFPSKPENDHIAYSGGYRASLFVFDNPIDYFSLVIASNTISPPEESHEYFLWAYDSNDTLLTFGSAIIPEGNWYLMEFELTGFFPVQQILVHNSGNEFAFDDITFSFVSSPEPCSFLLFSIGLFGFAGIKRKIRKKA